MLDLVQKPLSISRWQVADFVDQFVQLAHRFDPNGTLCQGGSDGQGMRIGLSRFSGMPRQSGRIFRL
jgi:hypothetical protein